MLLHLIILHLIMQGIILHLILLLPLQLPLPLLLLPLLLLQLLPLCCCCRWLLILPLLPLLQLLPRCWSCCCCPLLCCRCCCCPLLLPLLPLPLLLQLLRHDAGMLPLLRLRHDGRQAIVAGGAPHRLHTCNRLLLLHTCNRLLLLLLLLHSPRVKGWCCCRGGCDGRWQCGTGGSR